MMNLVCSETKRIYPVEEARWRSESGALLNLDWTPVFDLKKIMARKKNLWRYREALPIIDDKNIMSVEEGYTPLLEISFDEKTAFIKQEQLFSSGSYKDRGATVLMSKIKELGIQKVVQDSSGNAGCAIAMYAAKANIACDIFVPADTAPAKIAQMQLYGAQIHKIPGSRENTADAAFEAAQQTYYASHCWNPFFFHGTKTFAYEVCEQMNWSAPDTVVVPAGHGTMLIGCYIGFSELLAAGIISKIPKIIAIQSKNCAPLFDAFHDNKNHIRATNTSPTLAEGIAIAKPLRAYQMVDMVRKTNGDFIAVDEKEITDALLLCGKMGYYIEPTSAAVIAGLRRYLKHSVNEKVVSLFTGHGLKSTDKILKIMNDK